MKKLGFVLLAVLMVLGSVDLSFAADRELTFKPVSHLDEFPATDPISGDYIPVLDGSAGKIKKLDASKITYSTNFFSSGYSEGSTSIASTVTPLTSANLAFGLIQLANGSPGNHPLPDGSANGKTVTIELLADPVYKIANNGPTAMITTGWSEILFDNANDKITLVWLDDTAGWIITSNNGCTITR